MHYEHRRIQELLTGAKVREFWGTEYPITGSDRGGPVGGMEDEVPQKLKPFSEFVIKF
jgi:hypothetical protein